MTTTIWRIATDARQYAANDLSGKGAELAGGRWNREGVPIVYAATNISLACLETIVHLHQGGLPLNRYLVEITIDDDLWENKLVYTPSSLPVGWDAEPASLTSIDLGSSWAAGCTSLLLSVPSVIVPEENNILINPRHPDISRIRAKKCRKWLYDTRVKN